MFNQEVLPEVLRKDIDNHSQIMHIHTNEIEILDSAYSVVCEHKPQ